MVIFPLLAIQSYTTHPIYCLSPYPRLPKSLPHPPVLNIFWTIPAFPRVLEKKHERDISVAGALRWHHQPWSWQRRWAFLENQTWNIRNTHQHPIRGFSEWFENQLFSNESDPQEKLKQREPKMREQKNVGWNSWVKRETRESPEFFWWGYRPQGTHASVGHQEGNQVEVH